MNNKIVIIENDPEIAESYYKPFMEFGSQGDSTLIFTNPDQVRLLVFTGGEDVDPQLYGQTRHKRTYCNRNRDLEEEKYFNQAVRKNIKMVGICRGAQFLCVMNGGTLVQHISGHQRGHTIQTADGIVNVTSSHHQMMIPPETAEILAWAEPKLSNDYQGDKGNLFPDFEYEGVYFPEIKALGVQWHPEWMSPGQEGLEYTMDLVDKLLTK